MNAGCLFRFSCTLIANKHIFCNILAIESNFVSTVYTRVSEARGRAAVLVVERVNILFIHSQSEICSLLFNTFTSIRSLISLGNSELF